MQRGLSPSLLLLAPLRASFFLCRECLSGEESASEADREALVMLPLLERL